MHRTYIYLFIYFNLICISFAGSLLYPEKVFAGKMLPSAIIKLPEKENVILVEKKTQTLLVYSKKTKTLEKLFQVDCSTGEVGGIKKEAGDKKTPEGVYFLKDEYEDKYLSPVYGVKAFPTDYPNLVDKRAGKNGSAIWIHGTNKKLAPMDSNGCIALENENIIKLSDFVTVDATPVIMLEEIQMVKEDVIKAQADDISKILDQWAFAVGHGSYHEFLSFYSSEYLPDISWWQSWLDLRKQAKKNNTLIEISRKNTGIYQHDQIFVALFDSFISSGDRNVFLGKRKLFFKKQNDTYKIVGDIFQNVASRFAQGSTPLLMALKSIIKPAWQETIIIEILVQWMEAWSAKDMEKYASFYADNFYSDGMKKKHWVKRKKTLAKKYDFISVSGRDFKVKKNKNLCEVVFFQEYESSGLTTQGTKRLKLVNKGGLWKIYQESWKEK